MTAPTDGANYWLGELLAVIHRDGGHYLSAHGIKKASKDALEEIIRLKVATNGAEALLREAREILRHSRNHTINVGDCDTCKLIERIDAHLSGKDRT